MYDNEGFLKNLHEWNELIAQEIAAQENIELTDQHWELLYCAREYQQQFDISPEMRPFIKWIQQKLGADKAKSIYLLSLFPNSPAKIISKIAGLPKPPNCL
jgi:tRNA 2-thiouridine synthesizing protein E